MLPNFCTQSITRIRPGTKKSRGSNVPDWSPDKVSTLKIAGCSVQPTGTTLSQDGRVLGITETLTAYIPDGSDVKAGDRIRYDGNDYAIDGEPRRWVAALNLSHIQLTLKKWEG